MSSRGVGVVLVVLWLAIAGLAQNQTFYLNDEPLSLIYPIIRQESSILVPLEEFGSLVGVEVSNVNGLILVRGAGFRQRFDESQFFVQDGTTYASLDWILELVDGKRRLVGGDIYIQTRLSEMVDVNASADQVTVRLTGFTPHMLTVSRHGLSETLHIHWPQSRLAVDPRLIRIGESNIQQVRIVDDDGVKLSIMLEPGTIIASQQLEADNFYALTFLVADTASHESIIILDDGIAVHERSSASQSLSFVYVQSWRDRFRLTPTVPATGFPTAAGLDDILHDNGAAVAISIDYAGSQSAFEFLIMDGVPHLVPDKPLEMLAIDLFGRWTVFSSQCSVGIKHSGRVIAADGVNRRLAYGEIVAYTPGYTGSIARGIPGTFAVVRVRDGRVVSIYRGPFVPADSSALLVVASGEAKERLSQVRLGDPVELVHQFLHADGAFLHAVSAGPVILANGTVTLTGDELAGVSALPSGSVLASDWQGGLYLLTFETHDDADNGDWCLVQALHSLPTPLKDAVLLSSYRQNALAYSSASGIFQLGCRHPIRLALSLVPRTP